MKRFQIVSDIHGKCKDERACDAAIAFSRSFKPDIRVIAGDLWDFAAIRQGASEDDRAISMYDDFQAGKEFANDFFGKVSENVLMLGNHDIRAYDLRESTDAVKSDLGNRMVSDIKALAFKYNAKLIDYDARDGVYQIGELNIVHGFHAGMSACAAHARIYGNVAFGHIHSIESFQTPGIKQKEARSIGCLCDLNPGYANRKTGKLRWSHGWGYGWLHDDGTYAIFQVRGINGKFYAPTDITEY